MKAARDLSEGNDLIVRSVPPALAGGPITLRVRSPRVSKGS